MGKAENDNKMDIQADVLSEEGTFLVSSVFNEGLHLPLAIPRQKPDVSSVWLLNQRENGFPWVSPERNSPLLKVK